MFRFRSFTVSKLTVLSSFQLQDEIRTRFKSKAYHLLTICGEGTALGGMWPYMTASPPNLPASGWKTLLCSSKNHAESRQTLARALVSFLSAVSFKGDKWDKWQYRVESRQYRTVSAVRFTGFLLISSAKMSHINSKQRLRQALLTNIWWWRQFPFFIGQLSEREIWHFWINIRKLSRSYSFLPVYRRHHPTRPSGNIGYYFHSFGPFSSTMRLWVTPMDFSPVSNAVLRGKHG